jgi:hypothetical protein
VLLLLETVVIEVTVDVVFVVNNADVFVNTCN